MGGSLGCVVCGVCVGNHKKDGNQASTATTWLSLSANWRRWRDPRSTKSSMALLSTIRAASAALHPYVPLSVRSSRYMRICGVTAIVMVRDSKLLLGRAIREVKTGLLQGFNGSMAIGQGLSGFFWGFYSVKMGKLFNIA